MHQQTLPQEDKCTQVSHRNIAGLQYSDLQPKSCVRRTYNNKNKNKNKPRQGSTATGLRTTLSHSRSAAALGTFNQSHSPRSALVSVSQHIHGLVCSLLSIVYTNLFTLCQIVHIGWHTTTRSENPEATELACVHEPIHDSFRRTCTHPGTPRRPLPSPQHRTLVVHKENGKTGKGKCSLRILYTNNGSQHSFYADVSETRPTLGPSLTNPPPPSRRHHRGLCYCYSDTAMRYNLIHPNTVHRTVRWREPIVLWLGRITKPATNDRLQFEFAKEHRPLTLVIGHRVACALCPRLLACRPHGMVGGVGGGGGHEQGHRWWRKDPGFGSFMWSLRPSADTVRSPPASTAPVLGLRDSNGTDAVSCFERSAGTQRGRGATCIGLWWRFSCHGWHKAAAGTSHDNVLSLCGRRYRIWTRCA